VLVSPSRLEGKTVVVTGASSGTGAQAARQLAERGARVVVVGRDRARTDRIAEGLGASRYLADFADLADVRRLAADLVADLGAIDVLLDNAGAAFSDPAPTVDGNEINYQVNALAPFLLLHTLTPALAGGRVVSTSSRSHRGAVLHHHDVGTQLDQFSGLGAHQRYARAKLAALLLHRAHQDRHPEIGIVDVHPGIVASDFGRYLGHTGTVLKYLARPFLLSPRAAAAALVALAEASQLSTPAYYDRHHPRTPSALIADQQLVEAVHADACARLRLTKRPSP
jgi:NAD(P)-dependent dehydrogenase (short-subunit alcohol dehydrogenase family)